MKLIVTKENDSSFGSALCGAISNGCYRDFEEAINKTQIIVSEVTPIKENNDKYLEIYKNYQKISQFTLDYYNVK
jgi:ribulose kinase